MEDAMESTAENRKGVEKVIAREPFTTYKEMMIGKTLYRITSVYIGKLSLKTALEELAVRKALQEIKAQTHLSLSE